MRLEDLHRGTVEDRWGFDIFRERGQPGYKLFVRSFVRSCFRAAQQESSPGQPVKAPELLCVMVAGLLLQGPDIATRRKRAAIPA